MKTQLLTNLTVKDICDGFVYDENEGKGLHGWGGRLVIQPEYQRHYIYGDGKRDVAVVESLMKGYPIGILYFVHRPDGMYEVLDGQQRITSFGRFVREKFAVVDADGIPHYYTSLDREVHERIDNAALTIYICEGEEKEIKDWFQVINTQGEKLTDQEMRNAVYSGPFVTRAKEVFSNSANPKMQKWKAYIAGDVKRQAVLERALDWVSKGKIDDYMSLHRRDEKIVELTRYFNSVIDWIDGTFRDVEPEMCGLEWGRLYETYHKNAYNPDDVSAKVQELLADEFVTYRKGIFEYVLGGCKAPQLLNIRVFLPRDKKVVYKRQTEEALKKGVSNCPLCAVGPLADRAKIWDLSEMDADHVTAWSNGGSTDIANCQMLCKTHNRAKGNR